jgi:hypothetical protein
LPSSSAVGFDWFSPMAVDLKNDSKDFAFFNCCWAESGFL